MVWLARLKPLWQNSDMASLPLHSLISVCIFKQLIICVLRLKSISIPLPSKKKTSFWLSLTRYLPFFPLHCHYIFKRPIHSQLQCQKHLTWLKNSIPTQRPLWVWRRWLDPMEKLLRCSPACRSKGPPKALASLMAKGGEVAQLLHGMPAVRETQDGSICGCSEKMGEKTTMIEQGDDVVVQCEMS